MADPSEKFQIDLYYDVISPYAWIAFESLLRYEYVWPIKVNLKPFSLRRIIQSSGNKPPSLVPAKSLYMLKDLERNNAFWDMKLNAPKNFMQWIKAKTSEDAMKLLLVIQKEKPKKLEGVSREFWKRIWTNGEPIFEREDFEKVLVASSITDTARYIDKISDLTIETELQKNTLDAIDSGAFGAPWIIVHKDGEKHAFFGSDRLHLIGHLIKERFHDGLKYFSKL
ncbi:hypothetical protein RB195_020359 [Necator americanus]|uniref:Glutathione S-transferase kappa n=1 Tax=Necator americanus TaxID=51031 RepID=A0ABR1CJV4_NECAM